MKPRASAARQRRTPENDSRSISSPRAVPSLSQHPACYSAQRPARREVLLFCLAALAIFIFATGLPIWDVGDSHEYLQMLQAWVNHGSPDVRVEDALQVGDLLRGGNMRRDYRPLAGFFEAHDGGMYCWHFWAYSLCAVPAYELLSYLGKWTVPALWWTNVLLYFGAVLTVFYSLRLPQSWRWMLLGLSAITPVIWYISWLHTEVYSWAFALLAVTWLAQRRPVGGAVFASLGALQNPPLLFLAVYAGVIALHRAWKARRLTLELFGTLAGVGISFVPTLFSLWKFGHPNLILRELDFPRLSYVSFSKIWSLLTDLNQGLLPYMPVLLLLSGWALIEAVRRRRYMAMGIGATIILMIVGCATSPLWVTAMAGLQRYAVWMLPVFAWMVLEAVPNGKTLHRSVAVCVAIQALIVLSGDARNDSLNVKAPARLVWNYAPALYNPVPMIFAQRVTANGGALSVFYPIGYMAPDGSITKILTNQDGLELLRRRFRYVDADWEKKVQHDFAGREDLFYVHPPRGAVRGLK